MFAGERGVDAGGLFREALTVMCQELQSARCALFVRSANNADGVGESQDKWTLNAAAVDSTSLLQLEFLGGLLGCALRTGTILPLNLPALFWKPLVATKIEPARDLGEVDQQFIQYVGQLRLGFGLAEEEFAACIFETWAGLGQPDRPLTWANRAAFADALIAQRVARVQTQMAAVQRGLTTVLGAKMLPLLSFSELESLVVGRPRISISVLEGHTVFRGGFSRRTPVVEWLWAVLRRWSFHRRELFLQFVFGTARLPPAALGWRMSVAPAQGGAEAGDSALPMSHTCFNMLNLPQFSSSEVLESRLLYAIQNCRTVDTDE